MSASQNSSRSSSTTKERPSTPDILISGSDDKFFRSLEEFIDQEKRYLRCPEEGPDELRYITYRHVFNKVIGRATAYKRLLLTIKAEYDDVIRTLQRREDEARAACRTLAASASHPESLVICQRRATHLRERISVVQRETAELQEEMKRQKSSKEQSTWIPGLTVAESKDPEALDRHLKHLEAQKAALLDRKSHCVSLEVKADLDTKLQTAEDHRDQLSTKNSQLKVLYKRLKLVSDRMSSWEDEKQQVPLEDLLVSTLENVRQTNVTDDEARSIDAELFEHEEPTGVDEAKLLADYLNRFIELFDSAQYEEAALLAAGSPRGVLRNLNTMELFKATSAVLEVTVGSAQLSAREKTGEKSCLRNKGITVQSGMVSVLELRCEGAPGVSPPLFLFLQALLMTVVAGEELPAALSLQLVHCALQHGALQLVTHAVNNNKLTFSEDMGDILTEHAQKNPGVADVCLALATVVYEACRLGRKSALSMCRRGLIHCAAKFMNHCEELTAEDCMWVLCHSPSLSLLQLLTAPQQGRAAILSVGVACSSLLADPLQQQLALQLLDSFVSRGQGGLEEVILQDSSSSVDVWTVVASLCSELNRADLSKAVLSVLLNQSGTRALSPDLEGARLMEHVFL